MSVSAKQCARWATVRPSDPPQHAAREPVDESSPIDSDVPTAVDHDVPSSTRPSADRAPGRVLERPNTAHEPIEPYYHDTIPSPPPIAEADEDA